jgi:hypothetical protein
MTTHLPAGTLLGTIAYGNSCRMKNRAVYPSEKVSSNIFLLSIYSKAAPSDFDVSCV